MTRRQPSIGIIGAGMSGLCQAITLRQAGIIDVTIYEKAREVGGTWRDNTYPDLSCDVPSRFYQYTFAINPGWSRFFSPGSEILDYFRRATETYELRDWIRFGVEIVDARFDDGRWLLTTDAGETVSHDFLISATGVLRELRMPDIDGLADSVSRLELFQRSAQWILPLPNPSYRRWTAPLHRRVPLLDRIAYRGYHEAFEFLAGALVRPGWRRRMIGAVCRTNLRTVRDPDLRRRLTPDYQPMCRRLVISAGFYRAIQRRNVHLVDAGIDHVEARGIVTADGALHELDVIVAATGFDAHAFMWPMTLTGRDGLTVEQLWERGPKAHLGVGLPGFPNFFMLLGPHSPVGNYSLTAIAEAQAGYIVGWIHRWRDREFDTIAPTGPGTDRFNASMHDAMPDTVWATGCTSWYLGADGTPELWPWTPNAYLRRLAAAPNVVDFEIDTVTEGARPR